MAKTPTPVSTSAAERIASYVWSGAKSLPELIEVARTAMEAERPGVNASYVLPNSWLNVLEELQALLERNGVIVEQVRFTHKVMKDRGQFPLEGIGLVKPAHQQMMLRASSETEVLNSLYRIWKRWSGSVIPEDNDDAQVLLSWLIQRGWTREKMRRDGYAELADLFPHISA